MMDGTTWNPRRMDEHGDTNAEGDDTRPDGSGNPMSMASIQAPNVMIGLGGRYPLATHFKFSPGGISYTTEPPELITVSSLSSDPKKMALTIDSAKHADDTLREYSLLHAYHHHHQRSEMNDDDVEEVTTETISKNTPHYLPSLSVLAENVFGRFTGCASDQAKSWADAMVLSQWNDAGQASATKLPEVVPTTEDEVVNTKPKASVIVDSTNTVEETGPSSVTMEPTASVAVLLKRLHESYVDQSDTSRRPRRPCGYVFKRGDIAWNCRTCQTDPTCVICDGCFRHSNHEGHEVFFHRTTPGGCCDCGDIEAWAINGCCDRHRPIVHSDTLGTGADGDGDVSMIGTTGSNNDPMSPPLFGLEDPMEAVRTAKTALKWAVETLTTDPAAQLPPRLLAALGIVIGACVQCIIDAVDGTGVGADAVHWTKRWADEATRIANNAPSNEDYYHWPQLQEQRTTANNNIAVEPATLKSFLLLNKNFPENFRLHLRLHNDDVHTYDEVIEALHEPRHIVDLDEPHSTQHQFASLVSLRENATEMTHHVDSDGQVTVKTYNNIASALRGYRRLKSRGLHCAVVSTAQVDMENRARALCGWLTELAASHPAAQALLVHALVQVPISQGPAATNMTNNHGDLAGVHTWYPCRMIPPWTSILNDSNANHSDAFLLACRKRFDAFPPHLASSYLTREEAELLHGMAIVATNSDPSFASDAHGALLQFIQLTGTSPEFYSNVPYRLPSQRYHKSPHALWGTLPSQYLDPWPLQSKHPLLGRLVSGQQFPSDLANRLTESIYVVDTDLRKQQEGERITTSVYPHKLPGLNMISGIGMTRVQELSARRPPLPSPMDLRHLLVTSSFRAPLSPILLLLLLDPYPTKQVRGALHTLFLSLLTNSRFKIRFAGALAVAYRSLSTLFCSGIGTEADTPLHFTVQMFTAGSLVRALCYGPATERLLASDQEELSAQDGNQTSLGIFISPIAHIIVRCIHTNLLGSTKELNMILNNTVSGNDENSQDEGLQQGIIALLPALTYVAGEHSLMTPLPAAPDDGFLDSRSTRHKRLPHLLRDLDYVIETPGTAIRLLLPSRFPVYQGPSLSFRGEDVLTFSAVFARMIRLAQGMDPQKRKISGGHVEYEQQRWLEAFGLSLNFGGTQDALAESPGGTSFGTAGSADGSSHVILIHEAMGNIIASLLREVKLWLYREGLLETGLPIPSGGANFAVDIAQIEALQRSTLHATSAQYDADGQVSSDGGFMAK
jgi:Putative zinc finger in N-recognin (UBR box)